jgi:hypothetical protein
MNENAEYLRNISVDDIQTLIHKNNSHKKKQFEIDELEYKLKTIGSSIMRNIYILLNCTPTSYDTPTSSCKKRTKCKLCAC